MSTTLNLNLLHSYHNPTTPVPNNNPIPPFTKKSISIPSHHSSSHHLIATFTRRKNHQINIDNALTNPKIPTDDTGKDDENEKKSFWGAVSLIIGTAVGPGMLALPAATIKSGPLPSTISILVSWIYVVSSIVLVAELSFATMEDDGVSEVSFTAIATKALGPHFGAFVALVYAGLSFALLVACVSGIGSLAVQLFPSMNVVVAHSLFPFFIGNVILFLPFSTIENANKVLCLVMLLSITTLVVTGLSVARTSVLGSFARVSWSVSSILPAIPVTVLTLGFHVITPFICKIAGNTISDARKAILIGGVVPLIMVLSWNIIVLGLAKSTNATISADPISMLLSVNPSALLAVQGFAFTALATSLIGYAVSFPKQLLDTLELIFGTDDDNVDGIGDCRVCRLNPSAFKVFVTPLVLGVPVIIGSHFRSTFSKALDFAGVYANCFLFGILPPVMTYIYQSRNKLRSSILPGGNVALLVLFGFSVILGIWH